jgi:GDP-L-fucose synthase
MMKINAKIYVTGHLGLLGSAVVNQLKNSQFQIITIDKKDLDLCQKDKLEDFIEHNKPDVVIHCAAKVGGIKANLKYPVEFINENIQINTNILQVCHKKNIQDVIVIGSNCMYPIDCPQPMTEDYLFKGMVEPSNLQYAMAKLSLLAQVEAYQKEYNRRYFCVIPASLYGKNDQYHLEYSHVTAAILRKMISATKNHSDVVSFWGTGLARRELLFADDAAKAILYLLAHYEIGMGSFNIGSSIDYSIREISEIIANVISYQGKIEFENTPNLNGSMRKLLDISKLQNIGFYNHYPLTTLEQGIKETYEWINSVSHIRGW